jgi:hypothetical protein
MIFALIMLAGLQMPPFPHSTPCWAVKKAVTQYGATAVESWARANGISEKEIEKAKRCLK